jgi:hypothetical protein
LRRTEPVDPAQFHEPLSRVGQLADHTAQRHFRVAGLQTARHRGSDQALRFGGAAALDKEIGIATSDGRGI